MRFLVDECTGPAVANWLRDQGYEVFSVYHEARGLEDNDVIEKAFIENWILITNDKDFGEKVFLIWGVPLIKEKLVKKLKDNCQHYLLRQHFFNCFDLFNSYIPPL